MKKRHQQKNHNSSRSSVLFFLIGLSALAVVAFAGCSNSEKTPETNAPAAPKSAPSLTTQVTSTVTEIAPQAVYAYNSIGRRDPFAPIVTRVEDKAKSDRAPLERYSIHDFKMTGVVWGGFGYNAMLEAPDGKGYFVRRGTIIGPNKGVVKKITETTLVIEEKFKTATGGEDRRETIIDIRKKQEGIQ